jgi:hypothetical protein
MFPTKLEVKTRCLRYGKTKDLGNSLSTDNAHVNNHVCSLFVGQEHTTVETPRNHQKKFLTKDLVVVIIQKSKEVSSRKANPPFGMSFHMRGFFIAKGVT